MWSVREFLSYRHPDGEIVPLFWRFWLAEKVGKGAGRAGCRHLGWRFWYRPEGDNVAIRCDEERNRRMSSYFSKTAKPTRVGVIGYTGSGLKDDEAVA